MTISAYSRAKAFCNLVSRGWPADEAIDQARQWAIERAYLGLKQVAPEDAHREVVLETPLPSGRLYLTARYGCYPQLFKVLAQASANGTVLCLAGSVSGDIRFATEALSQFAGCAIEFVPVSAASLRSVRSKLARGHNAVMLIDAPMRTAASGKVMPIDTSLGSYFATSGLSRLPGIVDREFRGVLCERRGESDMILGLEGADFAAVVGSLARHIVGRPSHYELLPDLHKQWGVDHPAHVAVRFDHEGQHMLLHAATMRAWKLPQVSARSSGSGEWVPGLADKLGVRIDHVYAL